MSTSLTPTVIWTKIIGPSSPDYSSDYAYAVTTGIDGPLYIAGGTTGNLDGQANAGGTFQYPGMDAFVTKYSPDGSKVWTRLLGTFSPSVAVGSYDAANAIASSADGSIS